jgi:hypothetical protein
VKSCPKNEAAAEWMHMKRPGAQFGWRHAAALASHPVL